MTTSRRVPPALSEFVAGPAEPMLAAVWAPAVDLLRALQVAVVDAPPSWYSVKRTGLVWLAGGALRAAHNREVPRDLDFFCAMARVHTAAVEYVREHYDHRLLGDSDVVTKLAVRFPKANDAAPDAWTHVDFVRRYSDSPLSTARSVDFVCCAAALSTTIYARHLRFEADAAARVLEVCAPWAPRSSLKRAERFVERGWTISPEAQARLQALADAPHRPEWDFVNRDARPEGEGWDYD